jgi:preprotein translocase subunit SecE
VSVEIQKTSFFKSVGQFLEQVRVEMTKVTWPKWDELVGSTIVVLILVIAFSLYLTFVDVVLTKAASWVFLHYSM